MADHGDFNAVLHQSEICGTSEDHAQAMREYNQCVVDVGLVSLPMQGALFSWHNRSEGPQSLWKRLDRMMGNEAWMEMWPNVKHIILDVEAAALCQNISDQEVKEVMFDIAEDESPGPDGFSSRFFKAAWSVVGAEVTKAVKEFYSMGCLLKQVNAIVLELIPKVELPSEVANYRPIACCNVIYKVITKIMVTRTKGVLQKLIDSSQNAFVPGRSISDNILLAQELFSEYNQMRLPPRCALKIDLRKAYDTVEWGFLTATLKLFNFPTVFIRWVIECVSTASYSSSLNESIHGYFSGTRGFRQRDPLSPNYLCLSWKFCIRW
ncbi:UNVERIFIED_CONTAM: hypothetical protein Slati_3693400 [Sesamum latifolium]|uniref:Reverse transcriptase domain-containing protein n=1 Tax=Sesamum latifolium TaxID=2727402 RepID=A0AAW2U371_9LAMI